MVKTKKKKKASRKAVKAKKAVARKKKKTPALSSKANKFAKMTASDVARAFGVTAQAVGLWHSKGTCPKNNDGSFCLKNVVAWKIQSAVEKAVTAAGGDPMMVDTGNETPTMRRYRLAQAQKVEYELSIKKGDHLPRHEVDKHFMQVGNQIGLAQEILDKKYPDAGEILRDRVEGMRFDKFEKEKDGE